MALNALVVSDPPHGRIDPLAAAELLGLTAAELQMKANFAAPEVWAAFEDMNQATSAADALRQAGLDIAVIDGFDLRTLPGPDPVSSFTFADTGFIARFPGEERELPYDAPTLGVFCKPPFSVRPTSSSQSPRPSLGRPGTLEIVDGIAGEGPGTSRSWNAEALELMTILDLYVTIDGEVVRTSIDRDVADFSGLGDLMQPSGDANMAVCIAQCERLFDQFTLDARLQDVQPRQRASVANKRWDKERRLLSFGTLSLRRLLGSIEPDLRDLTQFELGSRLSCMLSQA